MRLYILFATALAASLIGANSVFAADVEGLPGDAPRKGIVAQRCLNDLQAFEQQLWRVGFGVLSPGGYGASAPPR